VLRRARNGLAGNRPRG